MRVFLSLILGVFLFSGCSHNPTPEHIVSLQTYKKIPQDETPLYQLKSKDPIALTLYDEYKKWHGTPYCYGGDSANGIDCSALVQEIFYDAFGIKVPRTTKKQAKVGYEISQNEIKAGDIVLFKTGLRTHHSGIYLERGNFINTSSTHGVTLSNLNNPYWKEKYWQSRRILP